MPIKKKVLFLLICIALIPLVLSGCYDLGDATEDDEEYCALYSEIRLIDGADDVTYYTMEDFYNKEAVNDFESPMDEDERKEYSYVIIKVEEDLSLGDIAVYFESTQEETLSVSFFILDESDLPTKVYTGKDGKYKLSECDEPISSRTVGKASCSLVGVADKWRSIYLHSWSDGETATKRHDIASGQYIVMRLDNNCYDPAQAEFEAAEAEWQRARDEYAAKQAAWQAVNNDSAATQAERDAAMTALSQALAALNVAERDYQAAQQQYESNKFPYKRVPVRMTAILINANAK